MGHCYRKKTAANCLTLHHAQGTIFLFFMTYAFWHGDPQNLEAFPSWYTTNCGAIFFNVCFTPHKELFYVELEINSSYFIWTSLEHHAEYNGLHPLIRHVLLSISG